MKRNIVFLLLMLLACPSFSQEKLKNEAEQDVINRLTKATAAIKTLQCNFEQTKKMAMLEEPARAEGTMHYKSTDALRWAYTSPYTFAFVVNGDKVMTQSENKTEVVDVNKSRIYKGIANIILGSVSGKKLFDRTAFNVEIFSDGDFWRAELTPLKKDMKRMFSRLTFCFDKKSEIINRVEFTEASGDVTVIQFKDMVLNRDIDDKLFKIN